MLGLILFFIIAAVIFIFVCCRPTSGTSYSSTYDNYEYAPESITKPKISAEIDDDFHREIRSYCNRKSLTISALIRKAVRVYLDTNP